MKKWLTILMSVIVLFAGSLFPRLGHGAQPSASTGTSGNTNQGSGAAVTSNYDSSGVSQTQSGGSQEQDDGTSSSNTDPSGQDSGSTGSKRNFLKVNP